VGSLALGVTKVTEREDGKEKLETGNERLETRN
jgi:hypothetical protein